MRERARQKKKQGSCVRTRHSTSPLSLSLTLFSLAQEDWGDIVTQKRIVREAQEKRNAELAGKTLDTIHDEGLEDSVPEADYDRATVRKRAMDDWKDDNVKGAGNTKRV